MAQLVSKTLHVIWLQLSGVMNHVVVGRCDSALTHGLRDHKEVIPSHATPQLVSWSLTSLFSTNMAISETKGQGWKVIHTQ